MKRPTLSKTSGALLSLLLTACAAEPARELSHDLLAELPTADVITEVGRLDFADGYDFDVAFGDEYSP